MGKSEQKENMRWGLLFILLQVAETVCCRYLLGGSLTDILRSALWMMLFGGIVVIYLALRAERFRQRCFCFPVIFVCVLFALPCALFYVRIRPMAAFYLGAVLIAAVVDRETGIIFAIYFCAAAVLQNIGDVEEAVSLLALGVVFCLLAEFLRKKKNILEVFLLAGIVTAILYLLRTSLYGSAILYEELGLELFSTASVLLCATILVRLYVRLVKKEGRKTAMSIPKEEKKAAVPQQKENESKIL